MQFIGQRVFPRVPKLKHRIKKIRNTKRGKKVANNSKNARKNGET